MRHSMLNTTAIAFALALLPLQAWAQQATQDADAVLAQAAPPVRLNAPGASPEGIAPTLNQNTPGQELRSGPTVTSGGVTNGLFPALGNTLLNDGIDFHGVLLDHFLANPSAGNLPGYTSNLGVFRPSADFDLGKIAGLSGATIHTSITYFFTKDNEPGIIADTGGAADGYQTTPILSTTILTRLTYEQRLLDDKLDLEVGRSNVHQYFFIPNSLDFFSYDSPVLYVDADFNSIPYGVYMGKATYHFTPFWYVQGGAFEDDYRDEVEQPFKLGNSRASGAQLLGEVAYRSEFNTEAYPAKLRAGLRVEHPHRALEQQGHRRERLRRHRGDQLRRRRRDLRPGCEGGLPERGCGGAWAPAGEYPVVWPGGFCGRPAAADQPRCYGRRQLHRLRPVPAVRHARAGGAWHTA